MLAVNAYCSVLTEKSSLFDSSQMYGDWEYGILIQKFIHHHLRNNVKVFERCNYFKT